MTSAVNQTPQQMQYVINMQKHSAHQPLDFSTPSPSESPNTNQSQDILDLCVRRNIAPTKVEHLPDVHSKTPSPVPQTFIQHPVTILQQHLMQQPQHLILHESRLEPHTNPEYYPKAESNSHSIISPPPAMNTGVIVAGYQQSMQFPIIKPTPLPQILNTTNTRCKPTRPFKAYPKDPLSLSIGVSAETFLGHGSNEAYTEFRRRMLDQVQAATSIGSSSNKSRSNMKRPLSPDHPTSSDAFILNGAPSSPEEGRDAAYWERRRKNNEAAKRSRDARRAKEDEIAIRAAFLEQENMKLKYELAALRNEAAKLRCMVYNS